MGYTSYNGIEMMTLSLEAKINWEPSRIKVAFAATTDARGVESVFDALWAALKAENHRFN